MWQHPSPYLQGQESKPRAENEQNATEISRESAVRNTDHIASNILCDSEWSGFRGLGSVPEFMSKPITFPNQWVPVSLGSRVARVWRWPLNCI